MYSTRSISFDVFMLTKPAGGTDPYESFFQGLFTFDANRDPYAARLAITYRGMDLTYRVDKVAMDKVLGQKATSNGVTIELHKAELVRFTFPVVGSDPITAYCAVSEYQLFVDMVLMLSPLGQEVDLEALDVELALYSGDTA